MSVAPSRFTKGVAVGSSRWAVRLVGTSLGLFLSVGAVSAAEDPPGSERTESAFSVLYERALVAYQAGHYADAIEALLVAYKLRPEPRLLYNIAQAHRKLGNLRKSREYFEQYLAADREIATDMKAEVQHQITELTAQERAAAPPPPQTPAQAPAQTPVQTPAQTPVLLPPKLAIVDSSHASRGPAPYQVQRWHKAVGAVLLVGGAGLLITGITFLALDGRCTEPAAPPAVQCGRLYQLSTPGAVQTALGGGLLLGGALTLAIPGVRAARARTVAPSGNAQAP